MRSGDLEEAIVTMVTKQVVSVRVLAAAVERATSRLTAKDDDPVASTKQLAAIEQELGNLTAAVAAGGDVGTLVAAIKERERRRDAIRREAARAATPKPVAADLRRELAALSKDWRRLLADRPTKRRAALTTVIKGRLRVETVDGKIRVSGEGTLEPVLSTGLRQNLASLMPASWNQIGSWLNRLDALRRAA
jgi:hypothetical protein